MTRILTSMTFLAFLAACGDGQPFFGEDASSATDGSDLTENEDDTEGDGGSIDAGTLLAGTDSPTDTGGIFRFETDKASGGGHVQDVSYDAETDTFMVDNLAFDGENVYQRGVLVDSLRSYAVFEADEITPDFLTTNPVEQIVPYRAVLGVSTNLVDGEPRTSFAIVRTGGYVGYGFGGFVYERSGPVVLPTTGQATFSGDYGGVQVYTDLAGLRYVTGDMTLDIDFEDFNANDGIKGRITNRQVFFENGGVDNAAVLSDVGWTIVEGVDTLTENGEIVSNVFSTILGDSDQLVTYFSGTFNGIVAGDTLDIDDGGEIVGVITMVAEDKDREISIQETGGAILYR